MSVGFYYLLLEHRNAAALDPDLVLREHRSCQVAELSVLELLSECVALATPVAYAPNAAEAQRQLRLLGNWELVLRESQVRATVGAKKAGGVGAISAQRKLPRPINGGFKIKGLQVVLEDHGYRPLEPRCQGGTPFHAHMITCIGLDGL